MTLKGWLEDYFEHIKRQKHQREARKRLIQSLLLAGIVVIHLAGAFAGSYFLKQDLLAGKKESMLSTYFDQLSIAGQTFFNQLFIIGIFLYALLVCFTFFGAYLSKPFKTVGGLVALSVAVAVLLSANPV
jgi:hypothetical protein